MRGDPLTKNSPNQKQLLHKNLTNSNNGKKSPRAPNPPIDMEIAGT